MKRFYLAAVFAFTALMFIAPRAHAIGVMASWWNMTDQSDDGWGGGLRQEIPLLPGKGNEDALVRLALDTRASYFRFKDAELNVIPLEVGGEVQLGIIYAELGGGYYIFDADHYDVDNAWGWYGLAGVMIGRGATGLFGEVKYTGLKADINAVKVEFEEIPTSIKADGVGINVGLSFGI